MWVLTTKCYASPLYSLMLLPVALCATPLLAEGEVDTISHRAIDSRPGIGREIQLPVGLPAEFQNARFLSELIQTVRELEPASDPLEQYSRLAELRKRFQSPAEPLKDVEELAKPNKGDKTLPPEIEQLKQPDNVLTEPLPLVPNVPEESNGEKTLGSSETREHVLKSLKEEGTLSSELLRAILSGVEQNRGVNKNKKEPRKRANKDKNPDHENDPSFSERLNDLKPFKRPAVEAPEEKVEVSDIKNRLSDLRRRLSIKFREAFKRRSEPAETNIVSEDHIVSEDRRSDDEAQQAAKPAKRFQLPEASTVKPPQRTSEVANVASGLARKSTSTSKTGDSSIEPSRQIMESLMEAMDSTGVELLDAVRDPQRRQDWGWVKDARRKATRTLRPYKRYFSGSAPRMSWVSPPPRRQSAQISMPSVDASTASDIVPLLGLLAVGGVLGMVAWRRFLVPLDTEDAAEQVPPAMSVSNVIDRGTVVAACHRLAVRRLGWRSRFWNHQRIFRSLSNAIPQYAGDVQRLGRVYEYARYAPSDFALNDGQLANIRSILSALEADETVQE